MSSKNNKKNIVIVNDFEYIQGGASKVAISTANELVKNKDFNVYFFSAAKKNDFDLDDKVIKICTDQGEALKNKNKLYGILYGLYNIKARRKLKLLLKELDVDNTIVHVHGWTKCLSSSVFDIIFKMKYNCVLTIHDYFLLCPNGGFFNYKKNIICNYEPLSFNCIKCNCDSRNYGFKLYRILRTFIQNKIVCLEKKIKNIITISNLSEDILKSNFRNDALIKRINNPIDLDTERKCVDIEKNEYFLYVGRVSQEKGVDIFCEAVSKCGKKGIVVGDGNQLDVLKERYNNITFVGWKDSKEVKKYMQNARCLIFPSRWYEGAPLTPIEAMQYGVPCLISSECAAKEYVKNENGLIFKLEVDDLIEKIIFLEDKIVEYGKNAYKYVSEIKKNSYIENVCDFYERVIKIKK